MEGGGPAKVSEWKGTWEKGHGAQAGANLDGAPGHGYGVPGHGYGLDDDAVLVHSVEGLEGAFLGGESTVHAGQAVPAGSRRVWPPVAYVDYCAR
jgi:hypothetical protein